MYRTIIVITSEEPIPDRHELENVIVGIGNGACDGEIEIGEGKWQGIPAPRTLPKSSGS